MSLTVDDLRGFVIDFVSLYPDAAGVRDWWRTPLLVTATADSRFDILPRIAADDHLAPTDLLASVRSIIVYFLPFQRDLVEENTGGKFAVRNWSLAYNDTNTMIEAINNGLSALLEEAGHKSAVTPPTANFDKTTLMSRWSHKHLAHIAGLGRFGVNAQMITPVGCAGRLGSLVTEAELGDHPLLGREETCRHKRGGECLECVAACPVKAVSEAGIDRKRCYARLKAAQKCDHLSDLPEHSETCGKCQTGMPCSFGPA